MGTHGINQQDRKIRSLCLQLDAGRGIFLSSLVLLILTSVFVTEGYAQWDVNELTPQPGKPAVSDAVFPGRFEKTSHKEAAWYLQGKKNDDQMVIVNLQTGDIRWKSKRFYKINRSSIAVSDIDNDGIDEILFSGQLESGDSPSLYVIRYKEASFTQSVAKPAASTNIEYSPSTVQSPKSGPATDPVVPPAPEPLIPDRLTATLQYSVPQRALVRVDIFNGRGDLVRTLVNSETDPGEYSKVWDGTGEQGERLKAGNYFYKITIGNLALQKKMVVFK